MKIISYYNRNGYSVCDIEGGNPFYTAGNHQSDSAGTVSPKSRHACSLSQLRSFAIQTGKDISRENHAEFVGAERTSDDCEIFE